MFAIEWIFVLIYTLFLRIYNSVSYSLTHLFSECTKSYCIEYPKMPNKLQLTTNVPLFVIRENKRPECKSTPILSFKTRDGIFFDYTNLENQNFFNLKCPYEFDILSSGTRLTIKKRILAVFKNSGPNSPKHLDNYIVVTDNGKAFEIDTSAFDVLSRGIESVTKHYQNTILQGLSDSTIDFKSPMKLCMQQSDFEEIAFQFRIKYEFVSGPTKVPATIQNCLTLKFKDKQSAIKAYVFSRN